LVSYEFTIEGYIVPYVRMTRRGKYVQPRAIRYLDSQDAIRWQLRAQMQEKGWSMLPGQTPLRMVATVERKSGMHKSDADNLLKALADAAQGVVFPNDLWIDSIQLSRLQTGRDFVNLGVSTL